ncbi:hypothetical protein EMPS_00658 [Entomortierella parvispora]|uniref:MSP domain-containing protein n=1 Tax=Entomortierella parvispora TaxID=205924 RepID=A0A9P3H246_9FUNG|nr:hypothetical protein EMPS_00658 [Entomortierella parvispora]
MSLSSNSSPTSNNAQSPTSFLRISPQNFQFTASKVSSGLVSKLKIKNLLSAPVGYKFKTNAPLRYSVKPVLGVLVPGQSIEVFVRCESWVNPQDRFLLQSIALTEDESAQIDAASWKELDRRRIIETFIQCASSSTLTMRDPQDDGGSISSSSSNSSSMASSMHSSARSAHSDKSRPQPQVQRSYHHSPGSGGLRSGSTKLSAGGRKMSTSSSTSSNTSSPPGSYPTLFTSSSKGAAQNSSMGSSHSASTKVSRGSAGSSKGEGVDVPSTPGSSLGLLATPVNYLTTKLSNSRQTVRMVSRLLAVRQYTKMQVFTVSVICLLLGLLLPLEKILVLVGGGPALPTSPLNHRNQQHHHDPFRNGVLTTRATAIRASPLSSSSFTRASFASSEPEAFKAVPEMNHVEVEPPSSAPPTAADEVEGAV